MPWTSVNATMKTKAADTPKKQKAWAATANNVLQRTGDDATAIKIANSVVNRMGGRYKRSASS